MNGDARRIRVVEVVGNGEGGGTKCVARIIRHLDPARYAMTVVAPNSPLLAQACAERDAQFIYLPISQSRVQRQGYAQFAKILSELQPDVVSAHGTRAAWYTLRALKSSTATPRIMYSEHLFSFDARRGVMRLPWIALERYLCQHVDALATACAANARRAETSGWIDSQRIVMRHYGIELEDFHWQAEHKMPRAELDLPENALVVGTVGRLIPQKGMKYLLQAAAMVLKVRPNVIFLIVGDGELRDTLKAQCQRLQISDNVRFLGASAQPWRILANCDVIAFSSLFEGLPQTCIEALTVGSAIVSTRMNGTAELITDGYNGILVPTHNANALAKGILDLVNDPELRQHFRERAPQAVRDYRTETMVSHFDDAYRSLYAQRIANAPASAVPVQTR
ncbi:MAG TPA: glycosyltransferase [Ktedonobacterales bacterium]